MSVTVSRPDRFPVGTVVGAYPASARHFGAAPSGAAVESHTVAGDGTLAAFTTLSGEQDYVLYAEVNGERRYVNVYDSNFVAPGTLKERLKARAEAINV